MLTLLVAASLVLSSSTPCGGEERLAALQVGDPAPALDVARWIRGEPVGAWRGDTVHVVDLWATWCGPCLAAMPHLSELQDRYGERVAIVAVSISEPEPEKVEPLVRELGERMRLRVAQDRVPDGAERTEGAVFRGWLDASGWKEIPLSFVIDRSGRVAWIGDSARVDEPLAAVVAGTWDLEKARAEHLGKLRRQLRVQELRQEMNAAYDAGRWEESAELCEEILEVDPEGCADLAGSLFQTLYTLVRDRERALAFGNAVLAGEIPQDASALGQIAYVIVFLSEARDDEALALAEGAARAADRLGEGELPSPLETLARIHFERGEAAEAVEVQRRAVVVARNDREREELEEELARYEEAAKGG